jgi:hypothetical protein
MKTSHSPNDMYTNVPRQHHNLFLGSFQLLFWLIFRPSTWESYIKDINPSLNKNSFLGEMLANEQWKKKTVRRFLVRASIVLPLLINIVISLIYLINGVSFGKIIYSMIMGTVSAIAYSLVVGVLGGVIYEVLGGVAIAIAVGVATGLMENLEVSIIVGLAYGISGGIAFTVINGDSTSRVIYSVMGFLYVLIGGLPYGITYGLVKGAEHGFVEGLIVGLSSGLGLIFISLRSTVLSIVLIPWHRFIYFVDMQRVGNSSTLLPKNMAFWDEWTSLRIWGLDKHLLLVLDKNPSEGQAALNYLSTSRQRWAAQAAQIELDARQLEKCSDAHEIGEIEQILTISELASPADTIFRSFINGISRDTNAALSQTSTYNQRLALTEVTDKQLNSLVRELTKSSDKYAVRFRPIAQRWQNIIDLHLQDLIKESEERQEINSPYIIGVPVTNRQQLFVGRTDTSEKLEKLLLDRRSPPLLLYGQRRTGKTSLLNNLGRLLPTSIIPLFVDLQGSISSAKDHTGFLYNLAKAMINSAQRQRNLKLPPLSYETLATDPFTRFDEWLDNLETALAGNTALLALDEFEVLDRVLNEGRFNENDVLGMLRNLIQHRPTFKVLLAGSHTLDEFQRWSSYLINAQVIHLGYLQEAEARQLIETPIENFALRYEPSASQRVLDITKGHPFLVQLLCAEIVALKNDQDPSIRRLATLADVEAAIPAALEHGSMFFSDIERNQLDAQSLQVLRYFAQQGEGAIISSADLAAHFTERAEIAESISGSIELLLRRELIETRPSGYSIQLELIRRWFI